MLQCISHPLNIPLHSDADCLLLFMYIYVNAVAIAQTESSYQCKSLVVANNIFCLPSVPIRAEGFYIMLLIQKTEWIAYQGLSYATKFIITGVFVC